MNFLEEQIVSASRAKRDLHKEEMTRFGEELTWLYNPNEIPEAAIGNDEAVSEQCKNLAHWMIGKVGFWSQQGFHKLHVREAVRRHGVATAHCADILEAFLTRPASAYGPGLMAMAEVHAVIPSVGKSHGINQDMWGSMARRASEFGGCYTHGGTYAQMILRDYMALDRTFTDEEVLGALTSEIKKYNPAKFMPDAETGITTVTPIDELTNTAVNIVTSWGMNIGPGGCVAVQTEAPGSRCPNMFEAFWSSYSTAADRLIYSRVDETTIPVVEPQAPEANYSGLLQQIFKVHRDFMASQATEG